MHEQKSQLEAELCKHIAQRRTFAIISHPDAGKTTLTEKLLLFGGAIQFAGAIKGRKAARHTTSDWMALEKQRGISVTTSVMQFPYQDKIFNLLDTPGHADFSEDTYRTLTAVDTALMVIDAGKGVEARTIKLLEVCRLRRTPIFTFINKMDREAREPIELLDEIEAILNIQCTPVTWPIGMGSNFRGIYHLLEDNIYLYPSKRSDKPEPAHIIKGLSNPDLDKHLGTLAHDLRDEIELVKGASHEFDLTAIHAGNLTPVYFGAAINNIGIKELLDAFAEFAMSPQQRIAKTRTVPATDPNFSGVVFKIQANMDPAHRDRIAFMRVCSGHYQKGMKMRQVRLKRDVQINNALTFMAGERAHVEQAWPGDIIGLHNHGTIQIGDTFTCGETLKYMGIPYFAPEIFRRIQLREPLKMKALQKGLTQLSEEGATQVFRPLNNNDLILGAVGVLQFDVVAYRLKSEYNVECSYDNIAINTARWISCDDEKMLDRFKHKASDYLALDGGNNLTYLAPTLVNLNLTMERWPDIQFHATREH